MVDSSSDEEAELRRFKIIVLGDGAVGKTSIIMRFTDDYFAQSYKQTIGVDFFMKKLELPRNVQVALQVWDIGGQQLGSRMLANYLNGSDAIILTYDITSYQSFRDLEDWFKLVQTAFQGKKMPYMAVCANKSDLNHLREVKKDKHGKFVMDTQATSFEVSAKSGFSVNQMFVKIAADLSGVQLSKNELDAEGKIVKAEIVNHPRTENDDAASTNQPQRPQQQTAQQQGAGGNSSQGKKKGCALM